IGRPAPTPHPQGRHYEPNSPRRAADDNHADHRPRSGEEGHTETVRSFDLRSALRRFRALGGPGSTGCAVRLGESRRRGSRRECGRGESKSPRTITLTSRRRQRIEADSSHKPRLANRAGDTADHPYHEHRPRSIGDGWVTYGEEEMIRKMD